MENKNTLRYFKEKVKPERKSHFMMEVGKENYYLRQD